jgi:hypothetical protein
MNLQKEGLVLAEIDFEKLETYHLYNSDDQVHREAVLYADSIYRKKVID